MTENWKRTARGAAYDYPALRAQLRELRRMQTTSRFENTPGGGGERRTVEDVALRELPPGDMLRLEAVEHALRMCGLMKNAGKRRQLAEMVYFRRSHTVYGAGIALGVSVHTAEIWNREFLTAVYGYLCAKK